MLNVLARVGIAIVGLVLGLVSGWWATASIVDVFRWEYNPTFAGWVLPVIGLGIIAGGVVGLIAGIILPYFWKRRRQAREVSLPNNDGGGTAEHVWPPAPRR
jgi:H+/gluconate symporter-like permease